MFIGYEGTPWYGWTYTFYLSVVLLLCAWLALTNKLHRKQTQLFILFGVVPLAVVIAISFIKPLFVNRYHPDDHCGNTRRCRCIIRYPSYSSPKK